MLFGVTVFHSAKIKHFLPAVCVHLNEDQMNKQFFGCLTLFLTKHAHIAMVKVVLRCTTVVTVLPRYHFSTVPVPLPLRYFLVPQYHKYRSSLARYLSVVDTQ